MKDNDLFSVLGGVLIVLVISFGSVCAAQDAAGVEPPDVAEELLRGVEGEVSEDPALAVEEEASAEGDAAEESEAAIEDAKTVEDANANEPADEPANEAAEEKPNEDANEGEAAVNAGEEPREENPGANANADAQPELKPNANGKPVRERPKCETAVLIRFEGDIHPMSEQYFYRKLDEARKLAVDLVIIEIESPGGYVDSSFNMAHRIRDIDWADVVVYIPNEALSGGAIMSLGANDIVMSEQAVMGDAGPIFQGPDALFRHAPEKVRSHVARRIRDLAETHDRPPALAEAMVDMELTVFAVTNKNTGEMTYKSQDELDSLDKPKVWEVGKPVLESRDDKFLEVNGERAFELGLSDGIAESRKEVAKMFAVKEPLIVLEPRAVDTAVALLNNPFMTGLLFIVGLVALYVELSAPGIGFGALVSGLCFALFFWSRFLGGTSGMLEVVLFSVGVVFLALELFVFPGFGIPGITGLLLMLAGVLMAGQNSVMPQTARDMHMLLTSLTVILGSGFAFLVAAFFVTRHFGSIPILRNFTLQPGGGSAEVAPIADGTTVGSNVPGGHLRPFANVGDVGVADSALRPSGRARFGKEYVDVIADGSFVNAGESIRVIQVSGNRILVREVDA